MNITDILSELSSASKPIVRKYQQEGQSHVLAIGLNSRVILKEHKSDIPAKILVIKGAITYISGNKQRELKLFEEHEIPIGEYHAVKASEDSIFLVIKN